MKIAARMLVSPAGALIALVSFFLPWYDFNCDGKVITTYGYEAGWPFWIAPIAAAGMLIAFAVGIARKNPRAARTAIRVLALALPVVIGLVVFLVVSEDARVGLPRRPRNRTRITTGCGSDFSGRSRAWRWRLSAPSGCRTARRTERAFCLPERRRNRSRYGLLSGFVLDNARQTVFNRQAV